MTEQNILEQIIDFVKNDVEEKYPQLHFSLSLDRGPKSLRIPMIEISNSESCKKPYVMVANIENFKKFVQLCVDDEEFMGDRK